MVGKVNQRGLRDWIIQRATALFIGVYAVFIILYLIHYRPVYYAQWHTLFSCLWMKIATLVVLLSILWHTWIGLWTVLTDYVKHAVMRLFIEVIVMVLLLGYLTWVFEILWVRLSHY